MGVGSVKEHANSSALQREGGSVAHASAIDFACVCQCPHCCRHSVYAVCVLVTFLFRLRLTAGLDGCIVAATVSVHRCCPLVAGAAHGVPAVHLGCGLLGRVCTSLCVCVCMCGSPPPSQQNRAYRFCIECSFMIQVHSFVSGLL